MEKRRMIEPSIPPAGDEPIGIPGYGLYVPEAREELEEIAQKTGLDRHGLIELGIRGRIRPSLEEQPIPMAVKAARRAFQAVPSLDPMDVDVVIWTGEEYKDYVAQTAGIRLQEEVGCRHAWAFDLVGQGVTLIQGLRVASDLMRADGEIRTVLLAGGTRNGDLIDDRNPHTRFFLAASASGGAVILRRGEARNVLLDTALQVDPEMADEVYVPGGGTEIPFSPEILGSPLLYYQVRDPGLLAAYLREVFPKRLALTIQGLLGGRTVRYVALRHLCPRHREELLGALHLPPQASLPLDAWGHHGTNDPLLSLHLALEQGLVSPGDFVVLASAGIGFSYAAALLRWGPWTAGGEA